MTPDRLDDLLGRSLDTGAIPADATPEERAELAPLLARGAELRQNGSIVRTEADASMPTARARFQRHLEAQRPSPAPMPVRETAPKQGFFGRLLAGRALTLASSAAAIGVIAIVAVLVLQPFSDPATASALTVDDYVQVEGVVSAAEGDTVTVESPELGQLTVDFNELTAVSDDAGPREAGSIRAGDPVVVSGVVTARRQIAASNVAVAANVGEPGPAERRNPPLLKNFREGIHGRLTVISLAPDGSRARVLLVAANQDSLLVDVDPRAMDQFLAEHPGALGSVVRVVRGDGSPTGVFALEASASTATPPAGGEVRPQFQNVRGVVVGRSANVLQVRTERGVVPVVLRPLTSIRFGDSGLTPEDVRAGERVTGWQVAITGNLEAGPGRRIIATLIVVAGRAPERPAAP